MRNIFVCLKYSHPNVDHLAHTLSEVILAAGHQPVIAYQEITERGFTTGQLWMPFVRDLLHEADLLVVVHDPQLRGGLIEVGIAYALDVPVWLLHQQAETVSHSLLGCAEQILVYEQWADIGPLLARALAGWD